MGELSRPRLLLLLAVGLLAVACQPVEDVRTGASADVGADDTVDWESQDLGTFTLAADEAAREWDGDARLVRLSVRLDRDFAWREVDATYVAPDADRMLVLIADEDGVDQEQPTLETLGFEPPTAAALEQVPEWPGDAVEPADAAEGAEGALDDCAADDDPQQVLYSNGVPGGWDGSSWTSEPSWAVAVLSEGGGVRLSMDGAVADDPCFEMP